MKTKKTVAGLSASALALSVGVHLTPPEVCEHTGVVACTPVDPEPLDTHVHGPEPHQAAKDSAAGYGGREIVGSGELLAGPSEIYGDDDEEEEESWWWNPQQGPGIQHFLET
jgi:hypothetical protein